MIKDCIKLFNYDKSAYQKVLTLGYVLGIFTGIFISVIGVLLTLLVTGQK